MIAAGLSTGGSITKGITIRRSMVVPHPIPKEAILRNSILLRELSVPVDMMLLIKGGGRSSRQFPTLRLLLSPAMSVPLVIQRLKEDTLNSHHSSLSLNQYRIHSNNNNNRRSIQIILRRLRPRPITERKPRGTILRITIPIARLLPLCNNLNQSNSPLNIRNQRVALNMRNQALAMWLLRMVTILQAT